MSASAAPGSRLATPDTCWGPCLPWAASIPLTRLVLNLHPQAWILGLFKVMVTFRSVLQPVCTTQDAALVGVLPPHPALPLPALGLLQSLRSELLLLPPGSSSSPGPGGVTPKAQTTPASQIPSCGLASSTRQRFVATRFPVDMPSQDTAPFQRVEGRSLSASVVDSHHSRRDVQQ